MDDGLTNYLHWLSGAKQVPITGQPRDLGTAAHIHDLLNALPEPTREAACRLCEEHGGSASRVIWADDAVYVFPDDSWAQPIDGGIVIIGRFTEGQRGECVIGPVPA